MHSPKTQSGWIYTMTKHYIEEIFRESVVSVVGERAIGNKPRRGKLPRTLNVIFFSHIGSVVSQE